MIIMERHTVYAILCDHVIIQSAAGGLQTGRIRMGNGRAKDAFRVFKGALGFAIVSGGLGALLLYFGCRLLFTGTLLKTPLSAIALKVLAPTVLSWLCSVYSEDFPELTMMPVRLFPGSGADLKMPSSV